MFGVNLSVDSIVIPNISSLLFISITHPRAHYISSHGNYHTQPRHKGREGNIAYAALRFGLGVTRLILYCQKQKTAVPNDESTCQKPKLYDIRQLRGHRFLCPSDCTHLSVPCCLEIDENLRANLRAIVSVFWFGLAVSFPPGFTFFPIILRHTCLESWVMLDGEWVIQNANAAFPRQWEACVHFDFEKKFYLMFT